MSDPHGDECADYLERIVYFIDNELDAADCSVVRAHLDSCNPCLEKYDLQRTVKAVVARSWLAWWDSRWPRSSAPSPPRSGS